MRMQDWGPTPTADQDVSRKDYLDSLLDANLPQASIDALIASGFSAYATTTYVDSQDALLATAAYVDAADATRLHLSQRNANNGYAGLDASAKVDYGRVPLASTQRWPRPFYAPVLPPAQPTVAMVSVGAGNRATGSSTTLGTSWTQTISAPLPAQAVVLVGVAISVSTDSSSTTASVTYGGQAMSQRSLTLVGSSTSRAAVGIYYLFDPPTGAQTVAVSTAGASTKTAVAGQSVAYSGVSSISASVTAASTGVTLNSGDHSMAFAVTSNGAALSGPNHTSRYLAGSSVGGVGDYVSVQDSAGAALVGFTNTGTAALPLSAAVSLDPMTWPSSGSVTATGETVVYSYTMADPGFTYAVVAFGVLDAQVGADNGTLPQVQVRAGSLTGPVVAAGTASTESYTVPAPGTASSRAYVNTTFLLTGAWTLVAYLVPDNTGGYTTTMIDDYLQVQATMPANLSASFTYSGAVADTGKSAPGVSTGARIVNNAGVVIATGAQVDGVSGTVTVNWTGNISVGQLYGIQLAQTGATTFATVSAGSFTIAPTGTVHSSAPADIVPVSFAAQTPRTGATTLYVTLKSSTATAVSVSNVLPSLWALPVPV